MLPHGTLSLALLTGSFSLVLHAGQDRTLSSGVYTSEQAGRGQEVYKQRCSSCHGASLEGAGAPPLTGGEFNQVWSTQPLSDLVNKIQSTMPANDPGKLTRQESAAIVAYVLQVGRFPAGRAELGVDDAALKGIVFPGATSGQPKPMLTPSQAMPSPPLGNMAQVMRGILFPSSNVIFTVQGQDPGIPKPSYQQGAGGFNWADWGAGIYSGWELVDYAAVTLADVGPLLLVPRRCENGKPAPVERPDWVKFTKELSDAGRAAYKASQSRNQDAVIEATDQLAESCLSCHVVYRDKPGGPASDPSNKAARCTP